MSEAPIPRDEKRCAALVECYRSEQMSEAQWYGHLCDEPGLKEYWDKLRANYAAAQS